MKKFSGPPLVPGLLLSPWVCTTEWDSETRPPKVSMLSGNQSCGSTLEDSPDLVSALDAYLEDSHPGLV
ncbi:hypothetical protein AMTR_s00062p00132610 [Amborella trichopoda]|uniref:Uncharacterized protein n=1 Tax=Amborella trichopoda TaxID=13333 RepID=U5DBN8_AMBTC|nr:hypothetical protein AMTR_s00062p00132610 [Amborella trichopoda]